MRNSLGLSEGKYVAKPLMLSGSSNMCIIDVRFNILRNVCKSERVHSDVFQ